MIALTLRTLLLLPTATGDAAALPPQEASLAFFASVTIAYLIGCGGWIALRRYGLIPPTADKPCGSTRPWLDLGLALLTAVAVLLLGQLYQAGWLLPSGPGLFGSLMWQFDNLIIFSPIAAALVLRKQRLDSIYLNPEDLGRKIAAGIVLALLSTTIYLALRGEMSHWGNVWLGTGAAKNLNHFLPVFLEGVALAFLFERVRWAVGLWPALVVPSLFFAVAHIPRQIDAGLAWNGMFAYFMLNTLLPMSILYVVHLSRDVIWIGIVHYVMDMAVGAFD